MKGDKRIERLEKDRRLAEANGDFLEAANVCNQLGSLLCEKGRLQDAYEAHQYELQLCEAMSDKMGQGVAYRRLGECLIEMEKDSKKALEFLTQYLNIATDEKNLVEEQRAHATLGRTYLRLAERETRSSTYNKTLHFAEASFQQSMRLCDDLRPQLPSLEFWQMKARLLLNLGLLHDCHENHEKSSKYLKEALLISQKQNFFEDIYRCQYNLADLARRHDNKDPALQFAYASVKTAQKMTDCDRVKEAMILRGLIHLNFGEFSEAKRIWKKVYRKEKSRDPRLTLLLKTAIKCCRDNDKLKDSSNAELNLKIHENLGDSLCAVELFLPAIRHYKQIVSIALEYGKPESTLADIYSSIAQSYLDLKKYSSAIVYFEEEMKSRPLDHEQLCQTLLQVAECHERQGQEYSQLSEIYDRAKLESIEASKPALQIRVLKNLAECQRANKRREELLKTEEEILDLEEFHRIEEEEEEEEVVEVLSDLSTDDDDSSNDEGEEFDRPSCSSNAAVVTRSRRSFKVTRNEKGETRLHTACINGNLKQVRSLLQKNHPANVRDFCGWTPLHEAANHGFAEIAEQLIDHGGNVNDHGGEGCGGITPLHDACACGNNEVIQVLLNKGANADLKDDEGQNALNSLHQYVKKSKLSDDERIDLQHVDQILRRHMNGGSACADLSDLLDSSKRSRSSRGHESSSDDDCEIVSLRKRRKSDRCAEPERPQFSLDSTDREFITDPRKAPEAYSSAISDLGSKSKPMHQMPSPPPAKPPKKKTALLNTREVGDDWLIDDVTTRFNHVIRDPLSRPINSPATPATPDTDDSEVFNFEPMPMMSSPPSPDSPVLGAAPPILRMSQVSLLPDPPQHPQQTNIKVKVRVLETLVLVPLTISDQTRTVAWLAEEVSNRYYSIHNQRPVLTLMTSDGAVILPQDNINAILSDNEEISGRVQKWIMLPLATKYKDACLASQCRCYRDIEERLAKDGSNERVNLKGLVLTPDAFLPISRALVNHLSLCELSLRGCPLGVKGAQHLANILPSLKNLQTLNLAVTALDSLALSALADCDRDASLTALQTLDLSYNLFRDSAMPQLFRWLKQLPALTTLKLISSGLSQEKFALLQTSSGISSTTVWDFTCSCK